MRRRIYISILLLACFGIIAFYVRLNISKSDITDNPIMPRELNVMHDEEPDEPNLKKIKEYKTLSEKISASKYEVLKGKVVKVSKQSVLTPAEEKEIKVITNALDAVEGKVFIPEGAKALIESEGKQYIVIFENKLPAGARGADYSARVTIDSESGEIVNILGGS